MYEKLFSKAFNIYLPYSKAVPVYILTSYVWIIFFTLLSVKLSIV